MCQISAFWGSAGEVSYKYKLNLQSGPTVNNDHTHTPLFVGCRSECLGEDWWLFYPWDSDPVCGLRIWISSSKMTVGWRGKWMDGNGTSVMWVLLWSVIVKKELSQQARLLICWLVYIAVLTFTHEVMRSQIHAADITLLHQVIWLRLKDRLRSPVQKSLE